MVADLKQKLGELFITSMSWAASIISSPLPTVSSQIAEICGTLQVQSLDETLQNTSLQMSCLRSDLRVAQQEKEALEQEVMSLHKQLQNANEKVTELCQIHVDDLQMGILSLEPV